MEDLDDDAAAFLKAIFVTDARDDKSALISAKGERTPGTCTWLLETIAYKTWLNTRCFGLWIIGGPGMGKSMLSIFLIEQLEEVVKSSSSVGSVIYFFCDNRCANKAGSTNILRGLIWQLGSKNKNLIKHALSAHKVIGGRFEELIDINLLRQIFKDMVRDPDAGYTYCVIDGLDECPSHSIRHVVNCFSSISTTRFKPIILSRLLDESNASRLANFVRLRLDPDSEQEVKKDLQAFIRRLSNEGRYPPALRQHVHDVFLRKSEGRFLWASLAAQEIKDMALSKIRAHVNGLDFGLHGIYSMIMGRIDTPYSSYVHQLLSAVTVSYEPLSLDDAALLSGLRRSSEVMNTCLDQCGRLLVVEYSWETRARVLRLGHESVKDYLLRKPNDLDQDLKSNWTQLQGLHVEIAGACLHIIASDPRRTRSEENEGFATRYAWSYFSCHIKESGNAFSTSLPGLLGYFEPGRLFSFPKPNDLDRMIHIASYLGAVAVVNHILNGRLGHYEGLRKTYRQMTPLHIAVRYDNTEVVRTLLQRLNFIPQDWSVSPTNDDGDTPLHIAATVGSVDSIQALLEFKADANFRNPKEETPLHQAVDNFNLQAAQLLVSGGAEVSARDWYGRTPLFLTVYRSNTAGGLDNRSDGSSHPDTVSMMKCLLEPHCNVNQGNELGVSPLHLAVQRTYVTETSLLLDWGANPDIATDWGFRPLHYITGQDLFDLDKYRARGRIAKPLSLDDQRKKDAERHARSRKSHCNGTGPEGDLSKVREIIGCFKAHGADLNAPASDGVTPLMCCAYLESPRCLEVAKCLLAAGVDMDAQDNDGNSCLHLAVEECNRSLVAALVDGGADKTLQNKMGWTPLDLILGFPEFWGVLEREVKPGPDFEEATVDDLETVIEVVDDMPSGSSAQLDMTSGVVAM